MTGNAGNGRRGDRALRKSPTSQSNTFADHYHAVRALGASAFKGVEILASDATRELIAERGQQT